MSWSDLPITMNGEPIHGSEGIMVLDQAHDAGARISLERGGIAPFSITCGIYGWMVHTRFFGDEAQARTQFDQMRDAIAAILDKMPNTDNPDRQSKSDGIVREIEAFVDRFP